ncbi:uncharacterized protein [Typha latifolia]|uniref:uncharacterized protein n=1 Tax=Typha latifolia TaxID=4733 RepID=UPI003C30E668
MPTFTAIALDRLLEPGNSRNPAPKLPPVPVKLDRAVPVSSVKKSIPRPHVSPALYATPESTPLPDSPSSFPPASPYIINHKRRGPRLLKSLSQNEIGGDQPLVTSASTDVKFSSGNGVLEDVDGFHDKKLKDENVSKDEQVPVEFEQGKLEDADLIDELVKDGAIDPERDVEHEDFFDPQDSLSTVSNSEVDDANGTWKPRTPLGEYYDAFEEIASNGAAYPDRNVEDELREMKLNLLTEIERRKQAEEVLENLQNQWERLRHHLSLVGLTLEAPPTMEESNDHSIDPAESLCQQITISQFVAGAIERGCSRAEVELQVEPQIELKNFEIARLWDRLHYYEAANREMCQRNQEAVEMARQHRHRRKRRQKWLWSSIGLGVTLGTAAIAWSYLPVSKVAPGGGDNTTTVNGNKN